MEFLSAFQMGGTVGKRGPTTTDIRQRGSKNHEIPKNTTRDEGEGSDSDAGDLSSNMTPVPSLTELNNLIDTYKNFKLLSAMAPSALKTDTDVKEDVEDKFIHFPTSNGG